RPAIPRAVFADERATRKNGRQRTRCACRCTLGGGYVRSEYKSQRGDVRSQRVVGHGCLGNELGTLRIDPLVDVLAEVAVWPAVEGVALDRGQVVRDQIAAEFVALVDNRPEHARLWIPVEPVRIAQAACKDAIGALLRIHLPDGSSIAL